MDSEFEFILIYFNDNNQKQIRKISLEEIENKLMGRRIWQHYQQILMENIQIRKRETNTMEWNHSDSNNYNNNNFCDDHNNQGNNKETISTEKMLEDRCSSHSGSYNEAEESEDGSSEGNRNDSDVLVYASDSKNEIVSSPRSLVNSFPIQSSSLQMNRTLIPNWYLPSVVEEQTNKKQDDSPDDDQPLDLSSKPITSLHSPTDSVPDDVPSATNLSSSSISLSHSSNKVPVLNTNRNILKPRPRPSTMPAARRSYTEEELKLALKDIQSGKLGTRKAAVIYGIPRSTLRNKVYKLAMEKERNNENILRLTEERKEDTKIEMMDYKEDVEDRDEEVDEEEKELSTPEEEKEVEEEIKPLFSVDDLIKLSSQNTNLKEADSLRSLLQGRKPPTQEVGQGNSPILNSIPQFSPPLYSIFPPGASEIWNNLDPSTLTPYLAQLMAAARENIHMSSMLGQANPYLSLGTPTPPTENTDPLNFSPKFPPPLFPELVHRMMVEERLLLEQQHRKEIQNKAVERSVSTLSSGNTSDETRASGSPSSVIARTTSYKPAISNNVFGYEKRPPSTPIYERTTSDDVESGLSPPHDRDISNNLSPPLPGNRKIGTSLRDVISRSIGHKFQQPQEILTSTCVERKMPFPSPIYTSVIRNHNNTSQMDDRKLNKTPLTSTSSINAASSSGGKGTRPKRGKYRNYDRDSLVEAVRAVQRGEMSVHRAGSYYGVPHSTLEYKVKERHLMRPRKREPKNPLDDGKRREEVGVLRVPGSDKTTLQIPTIAAKPSKIQFPPSTPIPGVPNGVKIPAIFDSPHHFPATPFPFWPPSPFHHLAMDFSRTAGYPRNSEDILAAHIAQKIQEESARIQANTQVPLSSLGKNTREVAENLYDGSGSNGTFLDSVIRSSLETGLANANKEAAEGSIGDNMLRRTLLEQLYHSAASSKSYDESDNESTKSMHSPPVKDSPKVEEDVVINCASNGKSTIEESQVEDSKESERRNMNIMLVEEDKKENTSQFGKFQCQVSPKLEEN